MIMAGIWLDDSSVNWYVKKCWVQTLVYSIKICTYSICSSLAWVWVTLLVPYRMVSSVFTMCLSGVRALWPFARVCCSLLDLGLSHPRPPGFTSPTCDSIKSVLANCLFPVFAEHQLYFSGKWSLFSQSSMISTVFNEIMWLEQCVLNKFGNCYTWIVEKEQFHEGEAQSWWNRWYCASCSASTYQERLVPGGVAKSLAGQGDWKGKCWPPPVSWKPMV